MDEDRQLKYLKIGMELTSDVTKKILEHIEDEEERRMYLEQMKGCMKDYINMEQEYKTSLTVLEDMKENNCDTDPEPNNNDIDSVYEMRMKERLSFRDQEDYLNDRRYQRLEGIILGYKAGDDGDCQDSKTPVDPWTRKQIQAGQVVTNRRCGHQYDNDTVNRHLQRRTGKPLQCPVSGCDKIGVR